MNRHEEFYAALMFFVERHYLRTHGSFARSVHPVVGSRLTIFQVHHLLRISMGSSGVDDLFLKPSELRRR